LISKNNDARIRDSMDLEIATDLFFKLASYDESVLYS
jgi:hypothetical protein